MLKLRVADVKQYIYCPRVIYFTYVCPVDKKVTRKIQYGHEAHLELDRLEKRRTFKRYNLKMERESFIPISILPASASKANSICTLLRVEKSFQANGDSRGIMRLELVPAPPCAGL